MIYSIEILDSWRIHRMTDSEAEQAYLAVAAKEEKKKAWFTLLQMHSWFNENNTKQKESTTLWFDTKVKLSTVYANPSLRNIPESIATQTEIFLTTTWTQLATHIDIKLSHKRIANKRPPIIKTNEQDE